ncbi:MAG TPA: hypothetical protein VGM32_01220 [Rhodopila sp.]|jgi:hypothetical protein
MTPIRRMLLIAAGFGAAGVVVPAAAQPGDSNVKLDAPGLLVKKPVSGLPDIKAQPQAWPRLDAGSVLCRTEDDLIRLGQRRAGDAVEGPVDCQVVRVPTAITILQRKGPGRTEVKPGDSEPMASGWTDAWLPSKVPSGPTSASR